jgi:hypothetical protein
VFAIHINEELELEKQMWHRSTIKKVKSFVLHDVTFFFIFY